MRVILMHGKSATPESKWYPWFRSEMIAQGHEYVAPILPHPENPTLSEWVSDLDECEPNEETIIVGHSRGGVAALRYLEVAPVETKIRALILIATNRSEVKERIKLDEENNGFYTDGDYDFEKILSHYKLFRITFNRRYNSTVCGRRAYRAWS